MKPTVFNYQEYERVVEENKKLNAEVADLRIRIADGDKRDCKSCKHQKPDGCSRWNCEYEPVMSGLISRQDAIEAIRKFQTYKLFKKDNMLLVDKAEVMTELMMLPSADRPITDCTKFMEWLKAEALDEENWELNAVANGEVICRKFKKMGWLDVEDGFYVDTRPTGEWVDDCTCSICHWMHEDNNGFALITKYNYCPNCGAKMRGEKNDKR